MYAEINAKAYPGEGVNSKTTGWIAGKCIASIIVASAFFTDALQAQPAGYTAELYGISGLPWDMDFYGQVTFSGTGPAGTAYIGTTDGQQSASYPRDFTIPGDKFPDGASRNYTGGGAFGIHISGAANDFGEVITQAFGAGNTSEHAIVGFGSSDISLYASNAVGTTLEGYSLDQQGAGRYDINNQGVLAFTAIDLAVRQRALVRATAGGEPEILVPAIGYLSDEYQNDGQVIVTGGPVRINENNDIAFIGQYKNAAENIETTGVFVYSAGSIDQLFELPNCCSPLELAFNDEGMVIASAISADPTKIFTQDGFGGRTEFANLSGLNLGGVLALDLNNSGAAAAATELSIVLVESDKTLTPILTIGDTLNSTEVLGIGRDAGISGQRHPVFINDAGEIGTSISLDRPSDGGIDFVVFHPEGTVEENPVFLNPCLQGNSYCFEAIVPEWAEVDSGLKPFRPLYVDPDLVDGYEYKTGGPALSFAGIVVPYPYGDGLFDIWLFDDATGVFSDSGQDATTTTYFDFIEEFQIAVNQFQILGIEPEAAPDPIDPRGFVVGLTFTGDNTLGFTKFPINSGDNECQGDATDSDSDGVPDICDPDDDNDGIDDVVDNCPITPNSDQSDIDADNIGDACDLDNDNDGVDNESDNCPLVYNTAQDDSDLDGIGDACDPDDDNDGIEDNFDNCPYTSNPDQLDTDADGRGDACDDDTDADGIQNEQDNCPTTANPSQADFDGDALGDACDSDVDGDTIENLADICPFTEIGSIVDASGCSVAQLCPCEGPRGYSSPWRNKGKFVSCTAKALNNFLSAGLITEAERSARQSEAAGSDCGERR